MKWIAMIWFTSIDGFHMTTKRNIVTDCVGNIFNFANGLITKKYHCTEEPCEHLFGIVRQHDRECTIRSFLACIDSVTSYFEAAFRSDLNSGSGKGYATNFAEFVSKCQRMIHTRNESQKKNNPNCASDDGSIHNGLPVDYESTVPISKQLFGSIKTLINPVNEEMKHLLEVLNVPVVSRSPFLTKIESIVELETLYTKYISKEKGEEESEVADEDDKNVTEMEQVWLN